MSTAILEAPTAPCSRSASSCISANPSGPAPFPPARFRSLLYTYYDIHLILFPPFASCTIPMIFSTLNIVLHYAPSFQYRAYPILVRSNTVHIQYLPYSILAIFYTGHMEKRHTEMKQTGQRRPGRPSAPGRAAPAAKREICHRGRVIRKKGFRLSSSNAGGNPCISNCMSFTSPEIRSCGAYP